MKTCWTQGVIRWEEMLVWSTRASWPLRITSAIPSTDGCQVSVYRIDGKAADGLALYVRGIVALALHGTFLR